MNKIYSKTQALVEEIILQQEENEGYKLNLEEHTFVKRVLTDFIYRATRKYIQGSREHGDGFLTEVNHAKELDFEIVDLLFYHEGLKRKHKNV